MPDARVTAAISHWAPRFVANGVPLTDFEEVTAGVDTWEQWCGAWSDRAAQHEALGREALEEGRRRSAGVHLTTAGVLYHFGKFLFVNDLDAMYAAGAKAIACRTEALPLLDPPGERVAVPFEGTQLFGNLRLPAGADGPSPVVVMAMGLDSAKEEMHDYEQLFLERGVGTFAFDGPGPGRGRGRSCRSAGTTRSPSRPSSTTSPPATTSTPTVSGCGVSASAATTRRVPPPTNPASRRASRCRARTTGRPGGTTCPTSPVKPSASAPRRTPSRRHASTAARSPSTGTPSGSRARCSWCSASRTGSSPTRRPSDWWPRRPGPTELLMIEDGNHVANNRAHRYRYRTADWMAAQLGVAPS